MVSDRRRKTVNATVALLEAMPEEWLNDVLQRLGARGTVVLEQPVEKDRRRCGVCTLPYPLCRARWADDHEWEEPRRKGTD